MKINTKNHQLFARFVDVYLDGVKQSGVLLADEEEGVVEVIPEQVGRRSGLPGRLTGKVEIRVRANDVGVTRELFESIEQWGDIHTAIAARMFGDRFVVADELGRKAMRAEAKARMFMQNYSATAEQLRQLVKDTEIKTATPADLDAYCLVDRDRPGGLACTLPKGHDGPHYRPARVDEKVEVCATSFVLLAVAAVVPDEKAKIKCRRCDRSIRRDECAWHYYGADLSSDWTCCTCVPVINGKPAPGAYLASEPRFVGKMPKRGLFDHFKQVELDPNSPIDLSKEVDSLRPDLLSALGVPAEFLRDAQADNHARMLKRLADAAVTPAAKSIVSCGHCGKADELAGPCMVCRLGLCAMCRDKPTDSHECPRQQRGDREIEQWQKRANLLTEQMNDLIRAIRQHFPDRLPPPGTGYDPVEIVTKILADARQNRAAKDLYDHTVARYEQAAKRYGAALKSRRFRLAVKTPTGTLDTCFGPGTMYEFDMPDRGPHYVVVLRADSMTHEGRNLGAWQGSLPPNGKLVMLPPGAEFTVEELVATDPLPADAVRRFPAFVETLTCELCGLTADQSWQ